MSQTGPARRLAAMAFLSALPRHWLTAAVALFVAGGAFLLMVVGGLFGSSNDRIRGEARIEVLNAGPRPFGAGREPTPELLETHLQTLQSPAVLAAAIEWLGESELSEIKEAAESGNATAWLSENVVVRYDETPNVLCVGMRVPDADTAQRLADAVAMAFVSQVAEMDREQRVARLGKLQFQHARLEELIRKRRRAWDDVLERHFDVDSPPASKKGRLMAKWDVLRRQIHQVKTAATRQEAELVRLRDPQWLKEQILQGKLYSDRRWQWLTAARKQLVAELAETKKISGPGIKSRPEILCQERMVEVQEELDAMRAKVTDEDVAAAAAEELCRREEGYRRLSAHIADLEEERAEVERSLREWQGPSDVERKRDIVKAVLYRLEESSNRTGLRIERLQLELVGGIPSVQLLP